ncbi:DUF2254 domain-containing protein [filamentous cyanobacterium CCP2]|nr:DUF2254 domain-containing protein [filamentous cyanobacterium CCP2]
MNNAKFSKLWDSLHSSYWFIPMLMAIGAIVLAFVMVSLDRVGKAGPIEQLGWVYAGGPDGARAVLSAVAGSMATVTATAFSITIVALQLAASNFGPRLLRNFMQDTGNQVVLGTFIATFIYCLLVLRSIHGEDYNLFVPQLAVTVGIGLAITSIGVLIYFIHHASTIIQASHVISSVSHDLEQAIDRLFPEEIGHSTSESQRLIGEIPKLFAQEAVTIRAVDVGYLQVIDDNALMKLASQHDLLIRLQVRPGQFILTGNELLKVYPREQVDRSIANHLREAFILGKERTEQQDIEFPIDQLVEIALRAISPAVNDPFTAIRCIDRLSVGLSNLAQRQFPSPYRYDETHNLRVIAQPVTFERLMDQAFNPIRQYAQSDSAVTLQLLVAITRIADANRYATYQSVLRHHAEMILRGSRQGLSEEYDRKTIEMCHTKAIEAIEHNG